MLVCRLCLWFGSWSEARWYGKAPDGTFHPLCQAHYETFSHRYKQLHILSERMIRNILAGRSPYA